MLLIPFFGVPFQTFQFTVSHAQETNSSAPASGIDPVELHQALLDLSNPWTVMCIAAHPDDEDGTSLIVIRHKYGVHTVSLFSTFGEGGQNAIGPELYEEMGVIRARETMAAAEIQGSEPYFLGLKDFGYSKSADEAFRVWGHDEALRRMVLQIRKLRPDVIITNHGPSGGHGHHQATGQLELEAFDAAADAKRFPEQLKDGITTWQVQRLFVRGGFGGNTQPSDNTGVVTIDPNERDTIRGTSYAEQALAALQKHATQGPWPKTIAERVRNSPDGKLPFIRYRLVREAKGADALTKESHNFVDGLQLPEEIARQFVAPTIDGRSLVESVKEPQRVIAALVDVKKRNTHESDGKSPTTFADPRVVRHQQLFSAALATASGVSAKLVPNQDVVEPGSAATFNFVISNNGLAEVRLGTVIFGAGYTDGHVIMHPVAALNATLAPGKTVNVPISYQVPAKAEFTVPHAEHLYDGRINGYPLGTSVSTEEEGVRFEILRKDSIDIGPNVEITAVSPSPFVVTPATANISRAFVLNLVNHRKERSAGRVLLSNRNSAAGEVPSGPEYSLPSGGTGEVKVPIAKGRTFKRTNKANETIDDAFTFSISQQDNARERQFVQRRVSLVYADARVAPNLRVGYVRGFDYSLPSALAALGVESKELSVDEVKTADLQKYSAIIVDNRVYESQPELIAVNQRLLDYAKDGGTLIVFYHKSNEWNPDQRRNRPQLAPYPITLNDERVTDENAPVSFIESEHPLLNSPNKIGQEDFAGWIQERGLYYPRVWDEHYHALLATNDPGEQPLRGGLLAADYGRGHYIYTSMVWYRQLRAGVPGGYRMLANMISYGR